MQRRFLEGKIQKQCKGSLEATEANRITPKHHYSVTAAGVSEIQDSQQEPTTLLQKSNYVPVDQCTLEWRAYRVGVITASKEPALCYDMVLY